MTTGSPKAGGAAQLRIVARARVGRGGYVRHARAIDERRGGVALVVARQALAHQLVEERAEVRTGNAGEPREEHDVPIVLHHRRRRQAIRLRDEDEEEGDDHDTLLDHFREEDTKKCRCCPCILSSLFDPGSSSSGPTLGNDVIRPTFYSTTQHHAPPVDMT